MNCRRCPRKTGRASEMSMRLSKIGYTDPEDLRHRDLPCKETD